MPDWYLVRLVKIVLVSTIDCLNGLLESTTEHLIQHFVLKNS